MNDLMTNFDIDDYRKLITDSLTKNKLTEYSIEDVKAVFYTDGGSRTLNSTNYGGWGIHGYLYVDKPTKSNSGCTKAVPTKTGYINGKAGDDEKAFVLAYLDYYGSLTSNSTNNKAEALAMLRCLRLVHHVGFAHTLIYTDSKSYVLTLLENKDTYINNGFKTSTGKDLANQELARCLIEMYDEVSNNHDVEVKWVKGHSGQFGNECADANATKGCFLASNEIRNVTINTDDDISNDYNINGDKFAIATPEDYFNKDIEAPKMLSENSLFFTTNGIDIRNNNTYFQASFGKMLNGKDKDERKMLRGKPFADCCISVVELNEPDPVLNNIIAMVADNFPVTGVVECNLSYQTRQAVYAELMNGGLNTVSVDTNKNRILLTNKEELASLTDPVRQAFRLINDFNAACTFLDLYKTQQENGTDTVTDITSYLYEKKETKTKTTYKTIDYDKGFVEIPVEINVLGETKTTHIPITIGVDTPSKVSLGRMKNIEPKVNLVTWGTNERTLRFAVVIETTEGVGVWMGIYSNIHLH